MPTTCLAFLGDRGVRFRVAHTKAAKGGKDANWIADVEFFPAVAGPADAGILDWVGSEVRM